MAYQTEGETVISAFLLGLIVIFVLLYFLNRRPSGLPPFPVIPLPIVGNLFSLDKDPRPSFAKWRRQYGDIFSLYLGNKLVIVLNGFECVKEALVKNADVFSDRPDITLNTKVFQNLGIASTSGEKWKSQRTFALSALRDFGFGRRSLEGKILEESEYVVEYFASKGGKKENFDDIYQIATSNILCSVVFGRRFEYDDPAFMDFCKACDVIFKNLPNTGLANFLPFLQYIPGNITGIKRSMRGAEYLREKLIKQEIERHFKEYDGTANDFISAYIKEIKDREMAGKDTTDLKENFAPTVFDLFIGGTETTATTLKWLFLFLIRSPDVQDKCFQEIKENVGFGRLPEMKDKELLPYVEATLAETQRLGNIAILGAFHGAARSTVFHGFNIPKGSVMIPNLDSVLMDPKVWPIPEKFRPERFLDKDGKFYKPPEFIPFSNGRRVCLGKALANMELFLIAAALIQRFQFQRPEDEPMPSVEPVLNLTAVPMPYKMKAVPRN